MSLERWEKRFITYPKGWNQPGTKGDLIATRACLKKWKGLRKEVLARYGLCWQKGAMVGSSHEDEVSLWIAHHNCALCLRVWENLNQCTVDCPLARVRKGQSCDDGKRSPYDSFCARGNPEPMIKLLEKAVVLLKQDLKKEKE